MRDDHGRYLNTKSITDLGPDWARGCEHCENGIVGSTELTRSMGLYLERLAQALTGEIQFCSCRAGKAYRAYLLNCRQRLIEEARQSKRLTAYALRSSHPDIEWALEGRAGKAEHVPTVHAG